MHNEKRGQRAEPIDLTRPREQDELKSQVTPQVKRLLATLQSEITRETMQEGLGLSDRKSLRESYVVPALQGGFIEMTIPEKPNSRLQKYRLTPKGKAVKDMRGDHKLTISLSLCGESLFSIKEVTMDLSRLKKHIQIYLQKSKENPAEREETARERLDEHGH